MKNFKIFSLFLLFLLVNGQNKNIKVKHQPLLKEGEKVLLSFKMKKSNKIMTLAVCTNWEYIIYRFGTKNKIELEFPREKNNSCEKFVYSFYNRGGGAENLGLNLNYITFTNENIVYKIYDKYYAENDTSLIGIEIINEKGKKFTIEGDPQSKIGWLDDLRDNEKIKIENITE
ncbi:MAG: hypothetical protein N2258_01580 [Brevinematales bacterium]|nr:hypothetical protein [Brevinematales bacterium]